MCSTENGTSRAVEDTVDVSQDEDEDEAVERPACCDAKNEAVQRPGFRALRWLSPRLRSQQ
jgi:hypothetical protein